MSPPHLHLEFHPLLGEPYDNTSSNRILLKTLDQLNELSTLES